MLSKVVYHFTFPPAMGISVAPHPLQLLVWLDFDKFSHSNR